MDEDATQPAAKRAGPLIVLEGGKLSGDGEQGFLHHVVLVRGAKIVVSRQPGPQKGRVQVNKPLPLLRRVLRPKLIEKDQRSINHERPVLYVKKLLTES